MELIIKRIISVVIYTSIYAFIAWISGISKFEIIFAAFPCGVMTAMMNEIIEKLEDKIDNDDGDLNIRKESDYNNDGEFLSSRS